MKNLILIVLTAISIQATAQEFAPLGAKWHYDQGTFNPGLTSFQSIESISDTVINGISCRKLMKISRMAGTLITYLYMYSENDSVFIYEENGFHLLYDFGAITGDTITLGFSTYNGSPLKMSIDSTSSIIINGETRKLQYVSCGDGMVIEFGGIVIEGIGNVYYMFPRLDLSLDGPLRCYEDSFIGLFINPFHSNNGWNFQDCEQVITSIAELRYTDITIYPNPASNQITIESTTKGQLTVMNLSGQELLHKSITEQTTPIDISTLPSGVYFVRLTGENSVQVGKFVKQ